MITVSALRSQVEQLAEAVATPNPALAEQEARTSIAQQEAERAANEALAARDATITQLQAQLTETRAFLQGRITVLERTNETQGTEIAALQAHQTKNARIAALAKHETKDTCKMQRFLGEFRMAVKSLPSSPVYLTDVFFRDKSSQVPAQLQALQTLIDERFARSDESVLLDSVRDADTEILVRSKAIIMSAVDAILNPSNTSGIWPSLRRSLIAPLEEILTPLIAARKARG